MSIRINEFELDSKTTWTKKEMMVSFSSFAVLFFFLNQFSWLFVNWIWSGTRGRGWTNGCRGRRSCHCGQVVETGFLVHMIRVTKRPWIQKSACGSSWDQVVMIRGSNGWNSWWRTNSSSSNWLHQLGSGNPNRLDRFKPGFHDFLLSVKLIQLIQFLYSTTKGFTVRRILLEKIGKVVRRLF